jgi:hypothetical protein
VSSRGAEPRTASHAPRQPRPGAARRAAAAAPVRQPRPRTGRLFVAFLLVLVLIAGVAIGIAAANSTKQGIHDVNVVYHDVQSQVQALKQLVSQNTK